MASYTYNALSPYSIFTEPKKGSICIYPAPLALKSALGPEQIPSKVSKDRLPLHFTDGKTAATIVKDPGQGYVSQSGDENGQNRKRVAGVKNKQRVNATWGQFRERWARPPRGKFPRRRLRAGDSCQRIHQWRSSVRPAWLPGKQQAAARRRIVRRGGERAGRADRPPPTAYCAGVASPLLGSASRISLGGQSQVPEPPKGRLWNPPSWRL